MTTTISTEVIDTPEQVASLVDWLVLRHAPVPHSPIMYVDLEGVNLCREGTISILTLMIHTGSPTRRICLIDVHTLGAQAFDTSGVKQKTLKDILQDKQIPKVFFDVRNDSDALFAHFGVALQGVEDVQLMESATRLTTASRKFVSGLAKCIENNLVLALVGEGTWKQRKEKGEQLFKAEHGGSYKVFNQRPMAEEIISYCAGDVSYLPELRDKFLKQREPRWQNLVNQVATERVSQSQKPQYQPKGPNRALAPWSAKQNRALTTWNHQVLVRLSR